MCSSAAVDSSLKPRLKETLCSTFQIEKEFQKRKQKYEDAWLKATKAGNEYMLCMDSANASIQKYFVDDLSDLIDVRILSFLTK